MCWSLILSSSDIRARVLIAQVSDFSLEKACRVLSIFCAVSEVLCISSARAHQSTTLLESSGEEVVVVEGWRMISLGEVPVASANSVRAALANRSVTSTSASNKSPRLPDLRSTTWFTARSSTLQVSDSGEGEDGVGSRMWREHCTSVP